ncbi:MAG: hypothetical protein OXT67_07530 [Zetaproteobacteria bacterium]|nr:hypothetical protein [Zetaproteobacteria bacterium]
MDHPHGFVGLDGLLEVLARNPGEFKVRRRFLQLVKGLPDPQAQAMYLRKLSVCLAHFDGGAAQALESQAQQLSQVAHASAALPKNSGSNDSPRRESASAPSLSATHRPSMNYGRRKHDMPNALPHPPGIPRVPPVPTTPFALGEQPPETRTEGPPPAEQRALTELHGVEQTLVQATAAEKKALVMHMLVLRKDGDTQVGDGVHMEPPELAMALLEQDWPTTPDWVKLPLFVRCARQADKLWWVYFESLCLAQQYRRALVELRKFWHRSEDEVLGAPLCEALERLLAHLEPWRSQVEEDSLQRYLIAPYGYSLQI